MKLANISKYKHILLIIIGIFVLTLLSKKIAIKETFAEKVEYVSMASYVMSNLGGYIGIKPSIATKVKVLNDESEDEISLNNSL
jgi:hypothetical protein